MVANFLTDKSFKNSAGVSRRVHDMYYKKCINLSNPIQISYFQDLKKSGQF